MGRNRPGVQIHPSADVAESAEIGPGTKIWHNVQIREGVVIGSNCILGTGVYIDHGVTIGSCCKIENGCSVFNGFTIEDRVILGPGVMLLNDRVPRATNSDGSLKSAPDWIVTPGTIEVGSSVGGGAIILPGVRVGRHALIGSGAVVTRDVPDWALAFGNPARIRGIVCSCGGKAAPSLIASEIVAMLCPNCGTRFDVPSSVYRRATTGDE